MKTQHPSITAANLRAAKAAISLHANWCRGSLKSDDGRMCALGAVAQTLSINPRSDIETGYDPYTRLEPTPEVKALAEAVCDLDPGHCCGGLSYTKVYRMNDQKGFSFVHRMFDKAIERLESPQKA